MSIPGKFIKEHYKTIKENGFLTLVKEHAKDRLKFKDMLLNELKKTDNMEKIIDLVSNIILCDYMLDYESNIKELFDLCNRSDIYDYVMENSYTTTLLWASFNLFEDYKRLKE